MIKMTLNFLIIFACWLICCAAIFTAIFHSESDNYENFTVSLTSLFAASLTVYNNDFGNLSVLGSIMISIFVIISAVMLINLLIALLTEAFSDLSKQADSRHRAILIKYRHRWEWDDFASYLIFAPPPINCISFLLVPFHVVLSKNFMSKLNSCYCKFIFFIIYLIPMLVVFLILNIIFIPLAYLKGFTKLKDLIVMKSPFVNFLIWFFFGLPILMLVTINDLVHVFLISVESLEMTKRNLNDKSEK